MKKTSLFLILLVFAVDAQARAGIKYFLPKATAMKFDVNPQWDKPLYAAGALFGYGFDSTLAVEVEGNYGVYGGDYVVDTASGNFSAWNVALYGVYRYPVLVEGYVKAKIGSSYNRVDHTPPSGESDKSTEGLGVSLGAGFGYVFKTGITLELDYTRLKNISHNVGLGLHYRF